MIRVAVAGLGKMGLSHLAMINSHPCVKVCAVCDTADYLLDVLSKYSGVRTYTDYDAMLRDVGLDAVLIATPSRLHAGMVKAALENDLHVFCEKPFCLDVGEAESLCELAKNRKLVNQVGYHYRFVGAFREVKRLLDAGAIGEVSHALAEAYGPVVLKPQRSTWRTKRDEGGGCLYDYAAHPINLVNWYFGQPTGVGGTVMNGIFSKETCDEVFSTLYFGQGKSAQVSVNWSDESYRKMSVKITIWGSLGRIYADRQECQAYLRSAAIIPDGYREGWNVRHTTELTDAAWFYLRGEEYSAQLDHFVRCIEEKRGQNDNSFESAVVTDRVISMMVADAGKGASVEVVNPGPEGPKKRKRLFLWPAD